MTGHAFARQSQLFRETRTQDHEDVYYDFVTPQSINRFMNCTAVDNDPNTLLETVTLPFVT